MVNGAFSRPSELGAFDAPFTPVGQGHTVSKLPSGPLHRRKRTLSSARPDFDAKLLPTGGPLNQTFSDWDIAETLHRRRKSQTPPHFNGPIAPTTPQARQLEPGACLA